jgi:hypothetical protein
VVNPGNSDNKGPQLSSVIKMILYASKQKTIQATGRKEEKSIGGKVIIRDLDGVVVVGSMGGIQVRLRSILGMKAAQALAGGTRRAAASWAPAERI